MKLGTGVAVGKRPEKALVADVVETLEQSGKVACLKRVVEVAYMQVEQKLLGNSRAHHLALVQMVVHYCYWRVYFCTSQSKSTHTQTISERWYPIQSQQ